MSPSQAKGDTESQADNNNGQEGAKDKGKGKPSEEEVECTSKITLWEREASLQQDPKVCSP